MNFQSTDRLAPNFGVTATPAFSKTARVIDLTRENIKAGVDLFNAYRRTTLIGELWASPAPDVGFDMIPGVASEVQDMVEEEYLLQLHIIERVTGCDQQLIHAVLETMDIIGCPSPCWVGARPTHIPFDERKLAP